MAYRRVQHRPKDMQARSSDVSGIGMTPARAAPASGMMPVYRRAGVLHCLHDRCGAASGLLSPRTRASA